MLQFNGFLLFLNIPGLFVLRLEWVIPGLFHATKHQPYDDVDDDRDENDTEDWQKHDHQMAVALAVVGEHVILGTVRGCVGLVWVVCALFGGTAPVAQVVRQTVGTGFIPQWTRFSVSC